LVSALIFLGWLGAISLWLSALPLPIKLPLAFLALGYSLVLARREAGRRNFSADLSSDGMTMLMVFADRSVLLSAPKVTVRGPLACVSGIGRDGRTRRLLWCPDSLPALSRRALRLRVAGDRIATSAPALATMSG
jgi:hypothetical protein